MYGGCSAAAIQYVVFSFHFSSCVAHWLKRLQVVPSLSIAVKRSSIIRVYQYWSSEGYTHTCTVQCM